MFLHANLIHLVGNLYFLYSFGDNVEDYLGPLRFTLLYFICGLSASLAHFASNVYSAIPTLGASGAISGILAAYMILFSRRKIYVLLLVWPIRVRALWYGLGWIGFQAVHAATSTGGVAWDAHIGGFLAGAILTKGYLTYTNLPSATASA